MFVWVLLGAYALDVLWGDPPNRWHVVAWMGHIMAWARRHAPSQNGWRFFYGMIVVGLVGAGFGVLGWFLGQSHSWLPWYLAIPVQVWVLNCTFSTRSLSAAARAVFEPLEAGELAEARRQLSYHLVSRDTSELSESQVAAAVIESVSENTSDSVVAPLFFYCVAGLPGALVYRYVNTCDAMWGYRTPEFEWLGKFAARLDDVLNWIPARLTTMLMLIVALLSGKDSARGIRIWYRDRNLTSSPNAGQPMSAAAGIIGVRLEKVNHYVLGKGLSLPEAKHIRESIHLLWGVSLLMIFVSVVRFLR